MKKLFLLIAIAGCSVSWMGCENKPVTTPPPADTTKDKPADAPAAADAPTTPAPDAAAPAPADSGKAP